MGLKNVFDRMFLKHLQTMLFKHFVCTVYQTFHDEHFDQNLHFFSCFINVLKMFPVKPSFLSYFVNV